MLRKIYSFAATAFVISTLLVSCGKTKHTEHIGEWSGVDYTGKTGGVVFERDGTGKIIERDTSISCRYEIDYSKRPIWLDLILTQNGKEVRMKSIIEFIEDNNKMRWRTYFDDTRPTAFLEKDPQHTIVLSRVEK